MPQLGQYPLFIITSPYVKSLLQVVHLYDNDLWQLGHALSSIFNGDEHIGHVILEEFFASSLDVACRCSASVLLIRVPHLLQNSSPSFTSAPQLGHIRICGMSLPHLGQNFIPSFTSLLQFGHFIVECIKVNYNIH